MVNLIFDKEFFKYTRLEKTSGDKRISSGVGFSSDAALRFAGYLRCDSRTIMKLFLKKIAHETHPRFVVDLHCILKFHAN